MNSTIPWYSFSNGLSELWVDAFLSRCLSCSFSLVLMAKYTTLYQFLILHPCILVHSSYKQEEGVDVKTTPLLLNRQELSKNGNNKKPSSRTAVCHAWGDEDEDKCVRGSQRRNTSLPSWGRQFRRIFSRKRQGKEPHTWEDQLLWSFISLLVISRSSFEMTTDALRCVSINEEGKSRTVFTWNAICNCCIWRAMFSTSFLWWKIAGI